mgnify:CR=1 FL=1
MSVLDSMVIDGIALTEDKNGIVLYNKDYISFLSMFKIFYLLILSLISYFLTNKILKKKINFDLVFLSLFIIPLFMPYHINIILYFLIISISLLFRKYYNVALIILILSLFNNFSLSMSYKKNIKLSI